MPDNEEDRVRIFVAHAICDPNAPLRTINKELEPEVSADSAVPVAKIVMNDLVLNMRKLSTAANEDHVIRFLRQWLGCFNAGVVGDEPVRIKMENTTYRFTGFPRVLQIVDTLNRSISR